MTIEILSEREREAMRRAGRIAAQTLETVASRILVGTTTAQIDDWVRSDTRKRGAIPSQLGYQGFPAAVCTSRNEVVCHGIPSRETVLDQGDILNVDVTSEFQGFVGDTSKMILVGEVSDEARHVCDVAARAVEAGIAAVCPGNSLRDVAVAVSDLVVREGCTVVRDFGGHGIGRRMHMPPHVSFVPARRRGPKLKEGMAFTIEPMVNLGGADVRLLEDGWTVVTADGSLSAQCEHTVLVVAGGCEVLTRLG